MALFEIMLLVYDYIRPIPTQSLATSSSDADAKHFIGSMQDPCKVKNTSIVDIRNTGMIVIFNNIGLAANVEKKFKISSIIIGLTCNIQASSSLASCVKSPLLGQRESCLKNFLLLLSSKQPCLQHTLELIWVFHPVISFSNQKCRKMTAIFLIVGSSTYSKQNLAGTNDT